MKKNPFKKKNYIYIYTKKKKILRRHQFYVMDCVNDWDDATFFVHKK